MKRNEKAVCKNCVYFGEISSTTIAGECRKKLPSGSDDFFPRVNVLDWCGEHPDFEDHDYEAACDDESETIMTWCGESIDLESWHRVMDLKLGCSFCGQTHMLDNRMLDNRRVYHQKNLACYQDQPLRQ